LKIGYYRSFANWIQSDNVGTGTGMGKIIQKQAKMERISQYSINEKPLF